MIQFTETNIIIAVIGMVGLLSSGIVITTALSVIGPTVIDTVRVYSLKVTMFFDPFHTAPVRYVVISDSQLSQLRLQQLENDILVLESQVNRYESGLAEVKAKLKLKKDLYKEAGALNGSKTTEALSQSGESGVT